MISPAASLPASPGPARRFALVIVPGFGIMAYAACVTALTVANRTIGGTLYDWTTVAATGDPVMSSIGGPVTPDRTIAEQQGYDEVLLLSSVGAAQYDNPAMFDWLRFQARSGARVGGITSGSWILARAGLLRDHLCTMHWMDTPAFRETFPDLRTCDELYSIDARRFTTAGGTATIDLMLAIFAADVTPTQLKAMADDMLHGRHRSATEAQRILETQHDARIRDMVRAMQAAVEDPVPVAELCDRIGVPQRTVEALFRRRIGLTPKRFYLNLRLERARFLIASGAVTVTTAALVTGFTDLSAFSTAYRKWRGHPPSADLP